MMRNQPVHSSSAINGSLHGARALAPASQRDETWEKQTEDRGSLVEKKKKGEEGNECDQ